MKVLIITQKIDKNDPIFGFFHNWVHKLSSRLSSINVICLEKGVFELPSNVKIFSLGKDSLAKSLELRAWRWQKIKYILNFYKYIWQLRGEYDAVFVHMNQEYVLLGGIFWRLLGKKIYFWRNHPKGSFLTRIAVWFSEKVFYTSPQSFTARFKKGVLMPVGINTELFIPESRIQNLESRKGRILSLGRISPIKNIDVLVESAILLDKEVDFVLDIVGDPVNQQDFEYYKVTKDRAEELVKKGKVNFIPAVTQEKAIEMYQTHQIFVNLTPSGSMDKTILESVACGCIPVVVNKYYKDVEGVVVTSLLETEISEKLENVLKKESEKIEILENSLRQYVVENHSIGRLIEMIVSYINKV